MPRFAQRPLRLDHDTYGSHDPLTSHCLNIFVVNKGGGNT